MGTKCGDAPLYIIDNTSADIAGIGTSIFALFGDDEAQREAGTEDQRRVRRSLTPASEPRRFVEILAKYRGDYGNLRISYLPASNMVKSGSASATGVRPLPPLRSTRRGWAACALRFAVGVVNKSR